MTTYKAIQRITDSDWVELERLAELLGESTPAAMVRAMARGTYVPTPKLEGSLVPSFLRAVNALVEKGSLEDAFLISEAFMKNLDVGEGAKRELRRLVGCGNAWVQIARECVNKKEAFMLKTSSNIYRCDYADFWVGEVGERRTYLRTWTETGADTSDEIKALRHNRIFGLDRNIEIEPFGCGMSRQGLDEIKARLWISTNIRYKFKTGDELIACNEEADTIDRLGAGIVIEKPVWSFFWLWQSIARYGENCVIISPAEVVELARSKVGAWNEAYTKPGENKK